MKKKAINDQVQPVVSLKSILNEEEVWAYNNQIDASKKCSWGSCGGLIIDSKCHKCGRPPDLAHNLMVAKEQAKSGHIRGTFWGETRQKSLKKKKLREVEDGK